MYRITTTFSGSGVTGGGVSQMYFAETAGTGAQAHVAVTNFWTSMSAAMSNTVTWRVEPEVEEYDAASNQVTGLLSTDATTGTGAISTDALPNAVQALVRWRTGHYINGREVRGRTFLPGMVEANNVGGKPNTASTALWAGYANTLKSGSTWQLSVVSRVNASAYPVTSASVWSEWAQLRSRRD